MAENKTAPTVTDTAGPSESAAASLNIYQKLVIMQNELAAPKGRYNEFGNYYYRSCEDILTGLKPLLKKYDCTVTMYDELLELHGAAYVKATVTLIDNTVTYNSVGGGSITTAALAREDDSRPKMSGAQLTGAASSYARKYALSGLFLIDDNADADALPAKADTAPKPQVMKKPESHPTAKQVNELIALAKQKGIAEAKIKMGYKVNKLTDLSMDQYNQAQAELQKRDDLF